MPKKFTQCANKDGSKMRTVSGPDEDEGLDDDEFVRYCKDPDSGEWIRGEVKKKKSEEYKEAFKELRELFNEEDS